MSGIAYRSNTRLVVLFVAVLIASLPASVRASVEAVEITDPGQLLEGPGASGQLGDLLIANDEVAFVIEAIDHHHGYGVTGGHLIDAAGAPGWTDEIDHVFALFAWFPRQAAYDTLEIAEDGSGGEAIVIARGADSSDPNIKVTTRYTLAEGNAHLTIETTLTNEGAAALTGHTAGDMIIWGASDNFAPGDGFDVAWETTATAWIAGVGETTLCGYASDGELITAEHGETWSSTVVSTVDVDAGGSATMIRYVVPRQGQLSALSDSIHEIAGIGTGTAEVTVIDGETGLGIPGALVDVDTAIGSTYTRGVADSSGDCSVTLPAGEYDFEASGDGYFSEEDEASVDEAQTTHVEIELMPPSWTGARGDTLTVVMRPIISIPAIVEAGEEFLIEAAAPDTTRDWAATIARHGNEYPLDITGATYAEAIDLWQITAWVPSSVPEEMYDLLVEASGSLRDTVAHSVMVERAISDTFYFIHVTDTHLPTHQSYYYEGADRDSSEMIDYRAVIEDANIINPAFILHTGDLVHEGELEDYLNRRYFTRARRITKEFNAPVYMVAGNHDIGGWNSTPPPDGTSRRDWWRFFGWRYLYDPPEGYGLYTQNYTFDYGRARFIGMEAYDNYDGWRYSIYGGESFTGRQMGWLADQLSLLSSDTPAIAFYHYDFDDELSIAALGIDCALWGHIHDNSGSITAPPFNLATDQCCDGARSYRLVRVAGNTIIPSATIRAGHSGERLTAAYEPANDGSAATVTATIVNHQPETFEHGRAKFIVPAVWAPYEVDRGTLAQTIVEGEDAVCYVDLVIPENDTLSVTIRPVTDPGAITAPILKQSVPNPTERGARISFVLPFAAKVTLEVFDVAGRRVTTLLHEEPLTEGLHGKTWDLTAAGGHRVASGVYLYRLKAGDHTVNRKMVVLR